MRYWQEWHMNKEGDQIQGDQEGSENESQEEDQEPVLGSSSSIEIVQDNTEIIAKLDEIKVLHYSECLLLSFLAAFVVIRSLFGGSR